MKNKTIPAVTSAMAIIALAAPVTFVTFAVLRLCHVIDWSWWLVTAPLWGGALLIASIFVVALIVISAATFIIRDKAVAEFKAKKGSGL